MIYLGRYATPRLNPRGNKHDQGHGDTPFGEPGVCNKLQEISVNTFSANGILRGNNKQCGNDPKSTGGESDKNNTKLSGNTVSGKTFTEETVQFDREIKSNNTCSDPSSNPNPLPSTTPNRICKDQDKLRITSVTEQCLQNRTELVDRKLKTSQRETISTSTTGLTYSVRCSLNRGLGSSMPGSDYRGSLVTRREEIAHQCVGIKSSLPGHKNLHKDEKTILNSHPNRYPSFQGTLTHIRSQTFFT